MGTPFENFVNLELPRRSALMTKAITAYDADPNLGGAPAILQNSPLGAWFYEETANKWWRKTTAAPATWVDTTAAGGGGFTKNEQVFTPISLQTVFTLSGSPSTPNDTAMFINTVKYLYTVNFTVSGNQVTWLNVGFTLDAQDVVEIIWFT